MIELMYFYEGQDGTSHGYQLIQFTPEEPWRVVLDGELLGSLDQYAGKWRQQSGADFNAELFDGFIALIDAQHFNDLPAEIQSRWPNLIQDVVAKSDQAYLVVCKEGISFASFQRIFCKFISGVLRDEWPISFQVFNHNFSEDFNVLAQPLAYKRKVAGWD